MLLLGILSVLQITLIPGFLLLNFLKIKTQSLIQRCIYIFALSLFLNYSIVTILTLLKIYTFASLWFILILELIWFMLLLTTGKIAFITDLRLNPTIQKYFALYRNSSLHLKIIIALTSIIILFYFALLVSNLGTVFYFVDTVNLIHWNTWAKDFANNSLPYKSFHFPQLIPANWSICYVLTGNSEVNFFPKSIMPLFFLANLLIFVDLAIWKKNYIYLIGLIIYGLFAPIIYSLVFIADGNADLPVSFFTFLTFYQYLRIDKNKFETNERILLFLFAATSATTKLAGFYVFLFASIFSLYGLIKNLKSIDRSKIILIFTLVPLILAISLFWHFLKPEVMVSGLHQPEYVGENYILIFLKAAKLMYYNWGLPVLAFLILTVAGSFFVKEIRYVSLIVVIPPLFLWMLKYSADFRNFSFVVPFLSYVSSFGLIKIIGILKNKSIDANIKIPDRVTTHFSDKQKIIGVVLSILCFGLFFLFSSDIFFNLILKVHKFISMYYFQSHRINLLVDYTQYISIDYYQSVLATMCIIIPVLYILIIVNVKFYQLIIFIGLSAIFLNFTFIKNDDIVLHQQKQIERIDARNYAEWMNTIIQSSGLNNIVYTNFESISKEKVPGNLNFSILSEKEIESYFAGATENYLFFLKISLLSKDLKSQVDLKISQAHYEELFNDGNYILLMTQSN